MRSAPDSAPSPVPFPFQLKTIVLATDFSPFSENTGRYAALMARQFDATLLVAHTFVLTQGAMEAEAGNQGIKSAQRAEIEAALNCEAQRLGGGLRHSGAVLLEGNAEEQIPQLARQHEPSMIVLGTQGRGRVDRALVGSVSEKILRSTRGPTLTVGPQVPPCRPSDPPIRRVVFATGLSPEAARGAAYAVGMAQAFHAELEVLHVIHSEDVEESGSLTAVQKRFEAELEAMVPHHAGQIASPRGVMATGTAHTRILEHIRDNSIDLLVLSLRRSSHLWLESRRSGAFHIISHATCPVLTVVG